MCAGEDGKGSMVARRSGEGSGWGFGVMEQSLLGLTEKRLGLVGGGMRGRVGSGAFRVDVIGNWKD